MGGPEILVNKPELRALFTKVGGEAGLERILRDFYERMAADIMLGFFFDGKDLAPIVAGQKAFLMRAMGATSFYSGKPPAQAHTALPPILTGHFDRRLRLLEQTLRAHGLSEAEIGVWVGFEEAFRESVIS